MILFLFFILNYFKAGLAWLTVRHRASCSPLVVDTTIRHENQLVWH